MIAINAIAQLTALGGVIVLQTVYAVVIARVLGVEDFGRYAFFFSITQILLIGCDLGLHNTAIRKISANLEKSPSFFSTFLFLKLALSFLLFLIVVGISVFLKEVALVLFGLGMFFHAVNAALNITFQAHGKLYLASVNQFLISVFNVGIGVFLLWMGGRILALGWAYLIGILVAYLINLTTFRRRVHRVGVGHRGTEAQSFLRESLPVGIGTLFNTVAARIDVTLLTLLVGSYQTGIYSAAYRISSVLTNIPLGIFSAVLPVMAASNASELRRLFGKSLKVMVGISVPLTLILFIFADTVIGLLYGDEYAPSALSLKILAWSLVPVFLGMAFSHVLLSQDRLVRRLPFIAGSGMAANILMNLILIPRFGATGAAVSTLVTELVLMGLYVIGVRGTLARATHAEYVRIRPAQREQ